MRAGKLKSLPAKGLSLKQEKSVKGGGKAAGGAGTARANISDLQISKVSDKSSSL